jgi:hypothetical protein
MMTVQLLSVTKQFYIFAICSSLERDMVCVSTHDKITIVKHNRIINVQRNSINTAQRNRIIEIRSLKEKRYGQTA